MARKIPFRKQAKQKYKLIADSGIAKTLVTVLITAVITLTLTNIVSITTSQSDKYEATANEIAKINSERSELKSKIERAESVFDYIKNELEESKRERNNIAARLTSLEVVVRAALREIKETRGFKRLETP